MSYETYRVTDLIDEIAMGPFGSNIKVSCFVDSGVPVLNGSNLEGFSLSEKAFRFVTKEKADSLNKANAHRGDIVITHRGTLGQIVFIPQDSRYDRYVISQSQFRVRCNDKVLPEYLVYYFHTPIGQHKLLSNASQVGVPALARPSSTFQQIEVELPELSIQKRVVEIITTIQKKIENNQELNDNLQQQARAIYKEWFIDFGQTSGTTPATWKHGKLKDVLQLHKRAIKAGANTTLPYLPIDTIPMQSFGVTEFRPNDEAKSSLITFQKDDIIVGAMRVYFHRVVLAPCDGITRTTCFTLSPYNSKYLSYALLTCDLDSSIDHAQNTSKGSTMPYAVWDGGMGEIEIVIPPIDVAEEFNNIVLPMLRQIQRNCEEIKLLGSLRDTLLPKLMSGEIDVSGIQL